MINAAVGCSIYTSASVAVTEAHVHEEHQNSRPRPAVNARLFLSCTHRLPLPLSRSFGCLAVTMPLPVFRLNANKHTQITSLSRRHVQPVLVFNLSGTKAERICLLLNQHHFFPPLYCFISQVKTWRRPKRLRWQLLFFFFVPILPFPSVVGLLACNLWLIYT